ncbi:MAG: urea transporter [Paramuribaculum sp.]|nr:urea transporter [Paramuribaculum sp.]
MLTAAQKNLPCATPATGVFFLAALAVSSLWAALWAAVGSAIALCLAILFHADPASVSAGLFGFSPVLTAIALGCTFYKPNLRSALWCVVGTTVTVFVQAGMDALMLPYGIPTLTGPFCVATWLFLLPRLKMDDVDLPDHSDWHHTRESKQS